MATSPPHIFSRRRRTGRHQRMQAMQQQAGAPRFIMDDMVEDILDRLAFTQHDAQRALVIGDWTDELARALIVQGSEVVSVDPAEPDAEAAWNEELPLPESGFHFIASLGLLDTVNDLPGALIHIRNALAPRGMAIASFAGAGSLSALRQIMLAADGDRPAARLHPMVDVRAGAQLLQRAGWDDPVVDSHRLTVRYPSFQRLIGDIRAMGLGNILASTPPPLGKAALARAQRAFAAIADDDGRVTEHFEIITLSGRKRR